MGEGRGPRLTEDFHQVAPTFSTQSDGGGGPRLTEEEERVARAQGGALDTPFDNGTPGWWLWWSSSGGGGGASV